MNRNSPVPLWAVLTVGVVILAGVYVFAQRTGAPPRASVIAGRASVVPRPSASAEPSIDTVPSTSVAPSATPQTIAPASDSYSGIVEIGTDDQLKIPGKYQCGTDNVNPPTENQRPYDHRMVYPTDILLEPSGKLLLHLLQPPGYGPEYDATFSKNCQQLYYFDKNANKHGIHVLDTYTGAQSTITIPIASFPNELVLPSTETPYYPLLKFIYAIDGDRLLLWFYNPVAGPDLGINDTSQAIYTVSTKALAFLSDGEMDPMTEEKSGIALLDYKTNRLIILGNATAEGLVTTRTEIDLATGRKTMSVLNQPGNPIEARSFAVTPCDYSGFDTHGTKAGYTTCHNMWLQQLLANKNEPYGP